MLGLPLNGQKGIDKDQCLIGYLLSAKYGHTFSV